MAGITPPGSPGSVGSGSGLPSNVLTKTANYTAVDGDFILANATGGGFTITLPATGTVIIVKTDASANVVAVAGTINGDAGGSTLEDGGAGAIFKTAATNDWWIVAVTTASGVGVIDAASITFTPTGTIAASNVQTAIAEVATDAAAALTTHTGATDPHGDRAYADGLIAANDALVYKGAIDASSNPNYPAASAGHAYKISVAGKIGGASGTNVEVNDLAVCTVDGTSAGTQAAVGANWSIIQANLDGAVIGPASATSGDFATFSGTGGKLIQDPGWSRDTDTALTADSDSKFPTQKAVKAHVAAAKGLPLALTGATAATRYVGGTASGAPASGTFAVGDFAIDQTGSIYVCTTAGTPGTWTQVAGGGGGSGLATIGVPRTTLEPPPGSASALNTGGANRAYFYRCIDAGTISNVVVQCTASSGNISVAICTGSAGRANPSTRVATSGAIPCPTTGSVTISLGGSVAMGVNHWFAISADNTSATFLGKGTTSAMALGNAGLGFGAYQDSAHPIPSSPAPTAGFPPQHWMIGT